MVKSVTAPFDASMNIANDQTFSKKGSIWREKDVKIEKSAELKNVVIGSGSIIGDGAVLTNTVIGRNCTVQSGVVVEDSIVWNNVTLNEGCRIHQSIITDDNVLAASTQLGKRTVLPPKTQLSTAMKIQDNEIFTVFNAEGKLLPKSEDYEDEAEQIPIGIPLSFPG